MNVYGLTFKPTAPAAPFAGELETDVSLGTVDWILQLSADTNEYTAFPQGNAPVSPFTTSTVPNFTGLTSALSQPFIGPGGYVTPTTGVTAILNGAGTNGSTLPAGFSWNSATLSYNGTATVSLVTGLSVTYTLTATGAQLTTNTFSISAVGGASDTFAPTIPTTVKVTLNSSFQPVITCDAQSDPSPPPANSGDFTGMKCYQIASNVGSNGQVTIPAGTGQYRDQLSGVALGSPAVGGTFSQTGAVVTLTGGGTDIGYGTSDQGYCAQNTQALTGSFVRRFKLTTLTNSANQTYAKGGAFVSPSMSPTDARVFGVCTVAAGGQILARPTSGGTGTVVASQSSAPFTAQYGRLIGTYAGSWTFEFDVSPDGQSWTTVGSIAGVSMPATVYTGLCLSAHDAVSTTTAVFAESCLSQDAGISFTDTAVTQTTNPQSYTGTWRSQDNAGNLSGFVNIAITIPGTNPVFGVKVVSGGTMQYYDGTQFIPQGGAVSFGQGDFTTYCSDLAQFKASDWTAICNKWFFNCMRVTLEPGALVANTNNCWTNLQTTINALLAAKIVPMLDTHWEAPNAYNSGIGDGQPGYLSPDQMMAYCLLIGNFCVSRPGIVFEGFNEPMDNGSSGGAIRSSTVLNLLRNGNGGTFMGSITGSVLTVSQMLHSSSAVVNGNSVVYSGAPAGLHITSFGTGTGGTGTYNLSSSPGNQGSQLMADVGTAAWYDQVGGQGSPVEKVTSVNIMGHQQLLDFFRSTGAPNVFIFSCPGWCNNVTQSVSVTYGGTTYVGVNPQDDIAPAGYVGTWIPQLAGSMHYAPTYGGMNPYLAIQSLGIVPWMTEYNKSTSLTFNGLTAIAGMNSIGMGRNVWSVSSSGWASWSSNALTPATLLSVSPFTPNNNDVFTALPP
jgi:hypothetical protein